MERKLPDSGQLSFSQIRDELGLSGPISLGQQEVRELAGVPTGPISVSDLHGKSDIPPIEHTQYGGVTYYFLSWTFRPYPVNEWHMEYTDITYEQNSSFTFAGESHMSSVSNTAYHECIYTGDGFDYSNNLYEIRRSDGRYDWLGYFIGFRHNTETGYPDEFVGITHDLLLVTFHHPDDPNPEVGKIIGQLWSTKRPTGNNFSFECNVLDRGDYFGFSREFNSLEDENAEMGETSGIGIIWFKITSDLTLEILAMTNHTQNCTINFNAYTFNLDITENYTATVKDRITHGLQKYSCIISQEAYDWITSNLGRIDFIVQEI
jgi:hypothetical protein